MAAAAEGVDINVTSAIWCYLLVKSLDKVSFVNGGCRSGTVGTESSSFLALCPYSLLFKPTSQSFLLELALALDWLVRAYDDVVGRRVVVSGRAWIRLFDETVFHKCKLCLVVGSKCNVAVEVVTLGHFFAADLKRGASWTMRSINGSSFSTPHAITPVSLFL